MNPAWAPTIVAGVVTLLGWGVTWGMFSQSLKDTIRRVGEVEADLGKHKDDIWPKLTETREDVSKIKGHLGINGGKRTHL